MSGWSTHGVGALWARAAVESIVSAATLNSIFVGDVVI
jgi:hypothetical protein